MKSGAIVLGIAVSVVLLAAAGALYVTSPSNGARFYRDSVDIVRQIQNLSSDWSVELARVKSDPLADFDSLAAFVPRMDALRNGLRESARRNPDLPDRLAGDLAAYLSSVEAKEERVERFKTGYAIVRNSARYLPLAAANVTEQADAAGDVILARDISVLVQDMSRYLARPTDAEQERLAAELQRLLESSVAYAPPLANALANLLSHAEVLLARQGPTEALFQAATSDEISVLTDRLAEDLEFEVGRMQALAVWYERGTFAVIAALALFWILLAFHQGRRGRAEAAAAAATAVPAPARTPPAAPAPRRIDPVPPPPPVAAIASAAQDLVAESTLARDFVAECVAGNLADTANRIATRMGRLRQAQSEIRSALQNAEAGVDSLDGADVDENMETAVAIASSVQREANAIADLAKRLTVSSRKPNGLDDRAMIDVNACVDEVVDAVGAESVATVVKKPGDLPDVFASKIELRLMLAKIVENAMAAVESVADKKGAIMIDTASKGDEILITVIDNGVGISMDRSKNIFKPFYTSRDGAMGIGLTLADRLAKKYNGSIRINSLTGQGTVARITLPAGASGS